MRTTSQKAHFSTFSSSSSLESSSSNRSRHSWTSRYERRFCAAGLLLYHHDGHGWKVLLGLERRHGKYGLHILGGRKEEGEDSIATASREWHEESRSLIPIRTLEQAMRKAERNRALRALWEPEGKYILYRMTTHYLPRMYQQRLQELCTFPLRPKGTTDCMLQLYWVCCRRLFSTFCLRSDEPSSRRSRRTSVLALECHGSVMVHRFAIRLFRHLDEALLEPSP